MTEILTKTILAIVVSLLVLAIAINVLAVGFNAENIKRIDEAKVVIERIAGYIDIKEASMCYDYSRNTDGSTSYTLNFNANIISPPLSSEDSLQVYPVLSFKGSKVLAEENEDFPITDSLTSIRGTFVVESEEPPLIRKDEGEGFSSDIDDEGYFLRPGQLIYTSNFLFKYRNIIKFRTESIIQNIPIAGSLPNVDLAPCTLEVSIECKDETKLTFLWLTDEKKSCYEQQDRNTCERNFNMCDGEITVSLNDFFDDEAECPDKRPIIQLDIKESAKDWSVGEDASLALLKVSGINDLDNECWQKDLTDITSSCFDLLTGLYSARNLAQCP